MDQAHNETPALIDYQTDSSNSESQTFLEQSINRAAAWLSTDDPLTRALQYWLDIHTIGVLIGEDFLLMSYRIDIELNKYDRAFLARFSEAWDQYRKDNRAARTRYWTRMTQHSEEALPYLRDLTTMLTNKGRKAREHLRHMQAAMIDELRKPNLEHARELFDNITEIYQRLQQEEAAETEKQKPKPNLPQTSRSPLGAPLSPASAALLARDPLAWHLQYWLDLGLIGNLRGEDNLLMGVRIEIEYTRTLSPALRAQFQTAWTQYQIDHRAERTRYWSRITLDDSDEARPYLGDLTTMLADKARKTRAYLRSAETAMVHELEVGKNFERAQVLFDRLARLYPRLQQEEEAGGPGPSPDLIELD
ncbi:hypothetical protein MMC07_001736 [Pseudocyphellaria aurata]|nr:hypothetical protein [Pseudocyphellaria aurata]